MGYVGKAACLVCLIGMFSGCNTTSTQVGLAQTTASETHRRHVRECLSRHTDQIFELSQIDPTYIVRYCKREASLLVNRGTQALGRAELSQARHIN